MLALRILGCLELNGCTWLPRGPKGLRYLLFVPLQKMLADPCSKSYLSLLAAVLWISGPVL